MTFETLKRSQIGQCSDTQNKKQNTKPWPISWKPTTNPLVLDPIDQLKHDLYLRRVEQDTPTKIAGEIRKFQSFYEVYMLHNKNEKQKALIKNLEAKFQEEKSLRE